MRRWLRSLVLPAAVFACAAAAAAGGGVTADRPLASTVVAAADDTDGDGLSDAAEIGRYHTDPRERDTDSDRLNDGAEVKRYRTNPRKPDTDGEGLEDGDEVKRYRTDPHKRDTDGDGFRDGDEVSRYKTNPRKPDTDGDGVRDRSEVNRYKTNPRKPDTDGDGLRDGDEVTQHKTNPRKADSDDDKFSDRRELGGGTKLLNARSHLGFPNASNTGVPAGTTLRPYGGGKVTANNAVLDRVQTSDCIIVEGAGVTIRNSKVGCIIVDGAAADPANRPLTVQDTEITCPIGRWNTGIRFSNYVALRVNIHGCENGLDIGTNVTLRDSYIHDLAPGEGFHNDGIQSDNGSNSTIEHNTIYAIDTSAININNWSAGPNTHNVLIRHNLLAGGGWTVYCPIPVTSNFRIVENNFSTIFSRTVGGFGPATACADDIQSGNVYHETGRPLNLG